MERSMHNALWQSVLGEIELSVSHGNFETWFKNTDIIAQDDTTITIGVANIFAKRQFEVKFDKQIRDILTKNGAVFSKLRYEVRTQKKRIISRETTSDAIDTSRIDELMDKRTVQTKTTDHKTPATTLNPRYNFKNFIVGSSNELAYTPCQAVAANPAVKYNPLFIYR